MKGYKKMSIIVAVDGPAGSGKWTVTKRIAKDMGLINLDTGATYRCVALAMIKKNIKLDETEKIEKMLNEINIEFKIGEEKDLVYLDGEDVTAKIREKDVTTFVSQVSSLIPVRLKMVDLQRKMAEGKSVIMEGRDIGTYVFPNADVKIYLDASVEERANRRFKENQEKGIDMTYDEIIENIKQRDYNDMHKEMGALKKADDAILVDSTSMSIDEVATKIEEIIKEKIG
jgi:cytidylate kinase